MTRGQPLEGAEPALKPRASREAGSPRAKDQLLCRLEGCWESRPSFPILALKMCQHEGERAGVGLMVGWEGAVADPITCGYLHWDPSPTLSARLLSPGINPTPTTQADISHQTLTLAILGPSGLHYPSQNSQWWVGGCGK